MEFFEATGAHRLHLGGIATVVNVIQKSRQTPTLSKQRFAASVPPPFPNLLFILVGFRNYEFFQTMPEAPSCFTKI